jgi:predicted O-methyltransferase YrrM
MLYYCHPTPADRQKNMIQNQWTAVDRYITDMLVATDPVLDAALQASDATGLPEYQVSPNEGKLLQLLAMMHGARHILEIGTLGGYSTIWLARALPAEGRLITLEAVPKHAEVARKNIANAGFADVVEVRVGLALDTLPQLASEGYGPFDLVFIDADKRSNPEYFAWALKLSRRGSVIIVDNVVRGGDVIDPHSTDPAIQGVRRLIEMMAAEPRVRATAIQTVGSKGYDGFALALVIGD